MANKRVTNESIQRELGELATLIKGLRHDLEEVKGIGPRVRSLELFRSYTKGVSAVLTVLATSSLYFIRSIFQ